MKKLQHIIDIASAPQSPNAMATILRLAKELQAEATSSATLTAVLAERERQDARWGGPAHDDQHDPVDWAAFIEKQTYWGREQDPRRRFIKVAALAFAAIESIDRKVGEQEAR